MGKGSNFTVSIPGSITTQGLQYEFLLWLQSLVERNCISVVVTFDLSYEAGGVCLNFVAVFWRNGYNVFCLVVCKWRVILQMVIFEQEGANVV